MNKNIKRAFRKEYCDGYDSARELTLELLDRYKSVVRYQSYDANLETTINDIQRILDAIDMSHWRDDTNPEEVLEMIQKIFCNLLILKSSGSTFLILEEKVNAALKRCVDVLAA